MEKRPHWDIFCRVVDNYGDAAVCWRLARQLAHEHHVAVRLWIDDPRPLAGLCRQVATGLDRQSIDGVEIRVWREPLATTEVADIVIEAFACGLPDQYLAGMCGRNPPPVWINLEYLSAEDWVEDCHARTSPHPRLPLERSFFFPGFTARTGGLLRERDYVERRARFDAASFRASLGLPPGASGELAVSLFGYRNPAIRGLLGAWSQSPYPVTCLVPEGLILADIAPFFGIPGGHAGQTLRRGNLTLRILPFLSQADYDRLLWSCDLNFVRGEDSFVRAQWAEKPFVWQAYPQADAAHHAKVDAFLRPYLEALPADAAGATRTFWTCWNGAEGDIAEAWVALREVLPELERHAPIWADRIAKAGDLAGRLLAFAHERLALPGKIR